MALADPPKLLSTSPMIEIDGQSYPVVARNLERMRMSEALGGLSSLELVLTDAVTRDDGSADFASGASSPLKLGAGVRVFAGSAEVDAKEIFDGQVTGIEAEVRDAGAPLFTILAEDRLFPARRKRRTRVFEDKSLEDVIRQVASDYGLTPEVRDGIDTTARTWLQTDETDLAFLRRILATSDADMQVVGVKLQVGRIGQDRRTLVPLAPGVGLKYARMTADIADQVSKIRLAAWDPKQGSAVDASKDAAGFGPGSGKTGKDVLAQSFSEVTMHVGRLGPMSDAEAQKRAQYEADRRARAFVAVTGTAIGNGDLRVGSWIELSSVSPQFANQYAVTRAVHRWDRKDGYLTDFDAQSAYLGAGQ
ncbi:MAG: phage late control D family protein [Alphaproteobacteria bacterium]|nr:phage late control D family protein [Alphaproteobacteria bacterium]